VVPRLGVDATLRAVELRYTADELDAAGGNGWIAEALRELATVIDAVCDGRELGLPR
jgi:hypothetical protein